MDNVTIVFVDNWFFNIIDKINPIIELAERSFWWITS